MTRALALLVLTCLLADSAAEDGTGPAVPTAQAPDDVPRAEAAESPAQDLTFQFLSGFYPRAHLGAHGPAVNYLPQDLRIGLGCEAMCPDCLPGRGVAEVLLAAVYAPVVTRIGSYITGPCAIVRYNFLPREGPAVPYLQGGAGIVFNDAWKDRVQLQVGEEFEFLLRAELGVRFVLLERLSLDVEGGLQHISNAGIDRRNGGLNNVGFAFGFTYFFPK
jgi:hypothetical protein